MEIYGDNMKVLCRDMNEIGRYKACFESLKDAVESGYIELGENDGILIDDILGYETASGDGKYYLDSDESCDCCVLVFEGKRNSFLCGSSMLGFYPRRDAGWSVVDSSHPRRGAFEGKRSYYRRMYKNHIIDEIDTLEVVKLPIDYFHREYDIKDGVADQRLVIVDEHDFVKGVGAQTISVVFDVRDLSEWEHDKLEAVDVSE